MRIFEALFLWSSIGAYLISSLVFLSGMVFKKEGYFFLGWKAALAGFLLHTLTIAVRWIESGHPPVLWRFEHALAGGWFVMAVFLALVFRFPSIRALGVLVGFAWVAYGAYHVAAGMGILYLLKGRAIRKRGEENIHRFFAKLPGLKTLDDLTFKLIVYVFISHIVMLGAGAIWAYGLWGRYWTWDP